MAKDTTSPNAGERNEQKTSHENKQRPSFAHLLNGGDESSLLGKLLIDDQDFLSTLRIDNYFAVVAGKALLAAIKSNTILELCGDDRLFQNALRSYAALYFLLGGNSFVRPLSDKIGSSESSVNRWINGYTSPNSKTRQTTLEMSEQLVETLVSLRLSDQGLLEITMS